MKEQKKQRKGKMMSFRITDKEYQNLKDTGIKTKKSISELIRDKVF